MRKIFFLSFIFTLFLSGCQDNISTDTHPAPATSQATNHQLTDQAAYDGALKLQNTTFCDKIEEQVIRERCVREVNDQKLLQQALAKTDSSLCQKMSTPDAQKACGIRIEVLLTEQKANADKQQAIQNIYDQYNKIVEKGDYIECKNLEDEKFRIACESSILTSKASNTKDQTWCDKISKKEAQEECKQLSAIAID